MKAELDFLRASPAPSRAGMLLLAAGVLVAGAGVYEFVAGMRTIEALEHEIAQVRPAPRERVGDDAARLRARVVLANEVLQRKTLPWDGLFRDIESASSSSVGLLAVAPDVKTGAVRISGEARDAAALADYITRLEAQASLEGVRLAQHELKHGPGRPVIRFDLDATWKGVRS